MVILSFIDSNMHSARITSFVGGASRLSISQTIIPMIQSEKSLEAKVLLPTALRPRKRSMMSWTSPIFVSGRALFGRWPALMISLIRDSAMSLPLMSFKKTLRRSARSKMFLRKRCDSW